MVRYLNRSSVRLERNMLELTAALEPLPPNWNWQKQLVEPDISPQPGRRSRSPECYRGERISKVHHCARLRPNGLQHLLLQTKRSKSYAESPTLFSPRHRDSWQDRQQR